MFRRNPRAPTSERSLLAWLGLLLMAVSFVWLQVTAVPRSLTRLEPPPPPPAPFAVVVIDPGHGGQDSGTMKSGLVEKDLALDVAHRVERNLQERGIVAVMTRSALGQLRFTPGPGRDREQPARICFRQHPFRRSRPERGDRHRDLLCDASSFVSRPSCLVASVFTKDLVRPTERREPEPRDVHPGGGGRAHPGDESRHSAAAILRHRECP